MSFLVRSRLAAIAVVFFATLSLPVLAQDDPEEKKDDEKPANPELAAKEKERQATIRDLFVASKIEFDKDGRVALTYDFTDTDEGPAGDFSPNIESVAKRMRWSRGYEGYAFDTSGIVINKAGVWLHKAVWEEVEIDIHYRMLSEIMKPTDIVAAVYTWNKGKTLVGSNCGRQCVRLKGLKHARNPLPRKLPSLLRNGQKLTFGLRLESGVMAATLSGKPSVTTESSKSFLKKLAPGRVGIAWNGQWVKGGITQIDIKGTLDKEWIEKQ